jgi:hypothetical protein
LLGAEAPHQDRLAHARLASDHDELTGSRESGGERVVQVRELPLALDQLEALPRG